MIAQLTQRNGHNGHVPRGAVLGPDGEIVNVTRLDVRNTGYANYGANMQKNALLGWMFRGGDADQDIGANVQVLRERSRDAFMGIPLAAGAVETLDTNVIGEGLAPAPNVDGEALGLDEQETADLNKELADKFGWWASDPRECDYEGKYSFPVLQSVAYKSMLLSGDCPVLFPLKQRQGAMFELKLRILEADRIKNPTMGSPKAGANIFTGVELSDEGELLAYHIAERHPLAVMGNHKVVDTGRSFRIEPYGALTGRRNMVLLIRPERPEQRRGVPILSVCLELLKQQGRYVDATVLGAVIQSYFTAFITSEFPDPTIFTDLLTEDQKKQVLDFNPYNVQLGPGIVNFMRPGHAVNFANPTQPQATFGEFTIAVAKFIGAALGIPYEVLLKQYNASYSASRAALLDFWKRVRKHRAQLIDQFCQPSYEEWMADAVSLNLIERFKGDFNDPVIRRAMLRCIWTGASAGSLDPQKEVAAAYDKVKYGFSTTEREASELNGSNYRDNIRQQSLEQTEFEEADLIYPIYRPSGGGAGFGGVPSSAPAGPPQAPQPPPPPKTKPKQPKAKVKKRRHESMTTVELASGLSGKFIR